MRQPEANSYWNKNNLVTGYIWKENFNKTNKEARKRTKLREGLNFIVPSCLQCAQLSFATWFVCLLAYKISNGPKVKTRNWNSPSRDEKDAIINSVIHSLKQISFVQDNYTKEFDYRTDTANGLETRMGSTIYKKTPLTSKRSPESNFAQLQI